MSSHHHQRSRAKTALKVGASGGLAWFSAMAWVLYAQRGLTRPLPDGPCTALVLGCPVSPRLKRRIDKAISLYQTGLVNRIIISGESEAETGAEWALQAGVDPSDLCVEPRAQNTYQNLQYSKDWLQNDAVLLVSCRWHLPRATKLAHELNLSVYPCPVEETSRGLAKLKILGREGFSVIHNLW